MRGVTKRLAEKAADKEFQPALPMRGVTSGMEFPATVEFIFQPALPMRGVTGRMEASIACNRFQPALPMRGVTAILCAKFTASINI